MTELFQRFEALGHRFQGVDLQFRPPGPRHMLVAKSSEWPKPWRAKLCAAKNERNDYRLTAYGASAEVAITELLRMVEAVDAAPFATVRLDG